MCKPTKENLKLLPKDTKENLCKQEGTQFSWAGRRQTHRDGHFFLRVIYEYKALQMETLFSTLGITQVYL